LATSPSSKPESSFLDTALIDALGVPVYTTDAKGRITLFNEEAAELWGRRPTIGKDLWCGSWRIFWPNGEPLPHEECPMAVALQENRPVRGVEIVVERPDGQRKTVLPYPSPLRDADGNLVGAVNVLIDVTERRKGEDAARLLAAIVESSDDAIVSKDLNGIIQSWNPGAERTFGYSEAEVIGRSIRMIIPEDRQSEEDEVLARIARGERISHFDTVRRRKDGTKIPISLTVSPIRDDQDRIIGASKVARNITDRKAAEEAVRESMAFKDQFLSLVSHELRTPIATIVGNALLLNSRGDTLEEQDRRQSASDIVSEGQKLQSIIENLLLLSRLEVGRALELEPLLLDKILISTAESVERRTGREVVLDVEPGLAPVFGQGTLVAQIIENLLSNADKYSPRDTRVEARLRANDAGQIELVVRDHGMGLSESETEDIFTAFYRSKEAKQAASGMGLGLAVCRRIVEAHGGEIWARNHPDGGAEFSFTLRAAGEPETLEAVSEEAMSRSSRRDSALIHPG
jgi:PAS domain S-box-containing protein